ncbi:hypothetical protein PsYK624_168540 [Phanerochaete sordida]|uniref:Cytochrome P450 n=1 Tax=Phanerochaete sordida TaxID=48140 RepID=A0A9P3GXV4_9APHY|nr:hypothetical protein PsYK624_168540 [Phanerochaete sordida]
MDDNDVELNPDVRDPDVAAFGFGRRICPGRHMAYESLWYSVAAIVAAFDIGKAADENGEEVSVDTIGYTDGFLSSPKEFKCAIRPRSPAHAKLVYAALEHE